MGFEVNGQKVMLNGITPNIILREKIRIRMVEGKVSIVEGVD